MAEGVNAGGDNTTRFIVIERAAQPPVMTGEGQRLSPAVYRPPQARPAGRGAGQIGAAALTWSASKDAPCPMYLLSIIFMYSLSVPLAAMPPPATVCWKP